MEEKTNDEAGDKYQGIIEHVRSMGWRFEFPIQIDPKLQAKIRNAKGGTKKWLEGDTSIVFPKDRSPNLVIKGNSKKAVLDTKLRLESFVAQRTKQNLTHFLSIQFTDEGFLSNFATFKDTVLSDFEVHKSLLQSAEKLHLTVVMLVLADDALKVKAIESLTACKEKFIDPVLQGRPLAVTITGVGVFADENPTRASVLFGKADSPELQQISNDIALYFEEQGLIKLDRKDVKLHLTLINAKFFEEDKPDEDETATSSETVKQGFRNVRRRVTFDATPIIERFKDFNFGTTIVNEIQISQLSFRDPGCYYKSIGALKF